MELFLKDGALSIGICRSGTLKSATCCCSWRLKRDLGDGVVFVLADLSVEAGGAESLFFPPLAVVSATGFVL